MFWNFNLNWLHNCFVGLENKSAYQNLKIDLDLYLGTFRSNNDTFNNNNWHLEQLVNNNKKSDWRNTPSLLIHKFECLFNVNMMQPFIALILYPRPVTTVSISLGKSPSVNYQNFEILIQAERCSLVNEHCNLVQINIT